MQPELNYGQALEWLFAIEAHRGMDFRLERIRRVLSILGDPQSEFPAIHVGGTNGKGSTAAMLHSMYMRAGCRVGLYTSPHLLSFRDRIRIGDEAISEPEVVQHTLRIRAAADSVAVDLTFFEIATIMAFLEFRRCAIDLAIIEVGLGGRLDATNVVEPVATILTSVSLEHCEYLGHTVAEIAREKAGIFKRGAVVVCGPLSAPAMRVVRERAAELEIPWSQYGRDFGDDLLASGKGFPFEIALEGAHQRMNAAIAVKTARLIRARFPIDDMAIGEGLRATRWPGRFEVVARDPLMIVDAAHNPAAISVFLDTLEVANVSKPRVLVFGVMADKDWRGMLEALVPHFDYVVLVPVGNRRALDPTKARAVVADMRPCVVAGSAESGVKIARKRAKDAGTVVVTGSIFLVAEVYQQCGGREAPFEKTVSG